MKQARKGAVAHYHRAVAYKIGAQRKATDDFDLDAVDLGFGRSSVHAEKTPGAPVDQYGVRLFQSFPIDVDIRKQEDRFLGIEGEGAHEKNFSVGRVFPEKIEPVRIERSRARDPRYLARGVEAGCREGVLRRKLIFVGALN